MLKGMIKGMPQCTTGNSEAGEVKGMPQCATGNSEAGEVKCSDGIIHPLPVCLLFHS